ncbi:unnamed protein product [Adineta ricciae]|uniref:ADP-ribosylation factor n=1 Tax=Adineta ricciae TaxID=249248 RepID=A0A816CDU2_ADIRI|nr:unnamed protein product [Adineta ricciae]
MGLGLQGMFNPFAKDDHARILMLGLDGVGKTTILYRSKLNETIDTEPTNGFKIETINPCPGMSFTVWDIGGQKKHRYLWHYYHPGMEGLIFVIDSTDRERIDEVREEFDNILTFPYMVNVPILIIANKRDLPNAMDRWELIDKLGINNISTQHKWYLQSVCARTGEGLDEGMLEMVNLIKQNSKENK